MKYSLTMFCVGGDRVLLTHSGDAEDPLRMVAKASPDSKTVEFDLDLSDGTQDAHMRRVIFTVIDADHYTEDWAYMMPGEKPLRIHRDLRRER